MNLYNVEINPPGVNVPVRASKPEGAVRAALHFHGREWRQAANRAKVYGGIVHCYLLARDVPSYRAIRFTPNLRCQGQRIYRANPFQLIREGGKVTTARDAAFNRDDEPRSRYWIGDLLEASEGPMRSGLVLEIIAVATILPSDVTDEMAFSDGFAEGQAELMRSFMEQQSRMGCLDLYIFRLREDLSLFPTALDAPRSPQDAPPAETRAVGLPETVAAPRAAQGG